MEAIKACPLASDRDKLQLVQPFAKKAAQPELRQDDECDDLLPPSPDGHHPFLDITRICCVGCVAIDHGNWTFGVWNILFSQDWVLQYLYLVCGVCYGMSSRNLAGYELRLGVYVVIGVLVNWSAWIITGMDWKDDFFNVVFHFWFVVGLMGYVLLLAPLRQYLHYVREKSRPTTPQPAAVAAQAASARPAGRPEQSDEEVGTTTSKLGDAADGGTSGALRPASQSEDQSSGEQAAAEAGSDEQTQKHGARLHPRDSLLYALAVIGGGLLANLLLFKVVLVPVLVMALGSSAWHFWAEMGSGGSYWGLPQNPQESQQFLEHMCTYFMLTCSNMYLIVACPIVFQKSSVTGWAVLLNTYLNRTLFHRGQDERPFHGLDLMMLTLTCYYLGLRHRRIIGEYIVRYWFLVLFACALLWPPGLHVRLDEHPPGPEQIGLRCRAEILEAIFIVVWLAAGERLVQREIFTEDKLDFLNDWALIVFLVHKAVHIMLVPPLNWVFLVAIAPACYAWRKLR